jgi:hypothetical protein
MHSTDPEIDLAAPVHARTIRVMRMITPRRNASGAKRRKRRHASTRVATRRNLTTITMMTSATSVGLASTSVGLASISVGLASMGARRRVATGSNHQATGSSSQAMASSSQAMASSSSRAMAPNLAMVRGHMDDETMTMMTIDAVAVTVMMMMTRSVAVMVAGTRGDSCADD